MLEIVGDMWTQECDALVILTNGETRVDKCAVMGAGTALQAKNRYPDIPRALGTLLRLDGNHVHDLGSWDGRRVYSFPTKHRWRDAFSDITLIERSCKELVLAANKHAFQRVVIPRPGCGAGGLAWSTVKPTLAAQLDDRFLIISP